MSKPKAESKTLVVRLAPGEPYHEEIAQAIGLLRGVEGVHEGAPAVTVDLRDKNHCVVNGVRYATVMDGGVQRFPANKIVRALVDNNRAGRTT